VSPAGAEAPAAGPSSAAAPAAAVEEFDFAQLTAGAPANDRALREANACIQTLEAWLRPALQHYTKDQPLSVRPFRSSSFQDMTLFTDRAQQLYRAEGGAIRKIFWPDLKPGVQGAIVLGVLRGLPAAPGREVARGAEAFAYVHGLPDMAAALLRDRQIHEARSR
jgi:hypothetical protein